MQFSGKSNPVYENLIFIISGISFPYISWIILPNSISMLSLPIILLFSNSILKSAFSLKLKLSVNICFRTLFPTIVICVDKFSTFIVYCLFLKLILFLPLLNKIISSCSPFCSLFPSSGFSSFPVNLNLF